AEVADEASIGFLIQLLRGSTRSNHAVEAGNRATRNGHEQQREHARGTGRNVFTDCRCNELRAGEQEGRVEDTQANEQLQTVDVVTWLKQHPHWQQRSAECVDEQDDDPDTCGWDTQDGLRQGDWVPIANEHQGVQRDHANNGNQRQVPLQTVDSLPNAQGDGDGSPSWDDRRRSGNQQTGDNHAESSVDHEQQQEDNHEEEHAAAFTNVASRQQSNRLAAVAL